MPKKSGYMLETPSIHTYSAKSDNGMVRTISRKDPPMAEILRDYTPDFIRIYTGIREMKKI